MQMMTELLLAAFTMGLVGSTHCIGMCGGIIGALSLGVSAKRRIYRFLIILSYNLGRLLGYVTIALVVTWALLPLKDWTGVWLPRVLAGVVTIMAGLYIGGWWMGLRKLEHLGQFVWRYLQSIAQRLMPVTSIAQALALGFLWGWLPCGLVYAALTMAVTAQDPLYSALVMLAFGLGTLPAVLLSGLMAQQLKKWLQKPWMRSIFAIIMICLGALTIVYALPEQGGHDHHHHH